jgi:hypothetical protein
MAWLTRTERAFKSVSRTLLESEVIFAIQDVLKTLCLISSTMMLHWLKRDLSMMEQVKLTAVSHLTTLSSLEVNTKV